MLFIQNHSSGLVFKVHVQPRSSRNQLAGLYGDALKVKVTAPPVEGKANQACIEILSKAIGVPRSSLALFSGQTSRLKHILLACSPALSPELRRRLESLAAAGTRRVDFPGNMP
jgi:uncharacterized protein (TIGR00251 family)